MSGPSIVVAATFTAGPIEPALAFWMRELGFDYRIQLAPYHQVFQLLLDPAGALATNRGGINVVLVRLEDWTRLPDLAGLDDAVFRFIASLNTAAGSLTSPLIVCLCPPSPAFLAQDSGTDLHARLETAIEAAIADLPGVHLIRPHDAAALYPLAQIHDPLADKLGHLPYTPAWFAALATMLARTIHAIVTPPFKVVALDCDDTLWRGICGEDGPLGIVLDAPRRALQEFMRAQHTAGMLLCLASKNNPEDVLDTFRLHPEMPLRLEDFVSWRINWSDKPANLAALAEELELSLDTFIVVDDSPKECREIEAACPQALALALPFEAGEIPEFLRHVWAFDHLRVTAEDRARSRMYAVEIERHRARRQAATLEEFLDSLQLEVRIAPMAPKDLARVAQLTHRTNQMNFTTVRRSESDVQTLLESGKAECLTVHVADRFGSYGLAGVIIFRVSAGALITDTFLLSCRALGRGVEHRMVAGLGVIARQRGIPIVEARYIRSPRNRPALLFLESVGLPFQAVRGDHLGFRFPADFAAQLRFEPSTAQPAAVPAPALEASTLTRAAIPYARIATELRDPEKILERVRAAVPSALPADRVAESPRSDLEARLCHLWSEMLGVRPVGIHDNFFDLGGHSLLAVQLLSRIHEQMGVELSLDVVYAADFTVAELAKSIELREIELAGAGDYARLLAEVEAMTDDEVRALLAAEGPVPGGEAS